MSMRILIWLATGTAIHRRYARGLLVVGMCLLVAGRALGEAADDSTGVTVAIKVSDFVWNETYGNYANFTVDGLNGSQSTGDIHFFDPEGPRLSPRFVVGQPYWVSVDHLGLVGFRILAVPPPGYIMEINGVPTERMDTGGYGVTLCVKPPAAPGSGRAGEATCLGTERTLWQLSLGTLSNGQSAGAVGFIDVGTSGSASSIFTPSGLVYVPSSSEVVVLLNAGGASAPYVPNTIRQIIAPQVCVDVVMTGQAQCELKVYHRSQGSLGSGGIYTFAGDPFAWYFFNQNGADPNAVRITCDLRNITGTAGNLLPGGQAVTRSKITTLQRTGSAPNYVWTADGWRDNQSGTVALARYVRGRSGVTETLTTATPGASMPVVQLTRSYASQPWGEEVGSETLGSSNSIVTNYAYWSTASDQSASYARLRSRVTDGQWEAYEYYDYSDGLDLAGALKRRHRPFNNSDTSVPDLASHHGEVTTYSWTDDLFQRATRLAQMETTVDGVTTAKTTINYSGSSAGSFPGHSTLNLVVATRDDSSANGAALTTVTKYFCEDIGSAVSDDFFRMQIHSIRQPDGVKQSFAYQRGSWNGSSFVLSGNGGLDAPSGVFASRISVITGSANTGTAYTSYGSYDIDDLKLIDGKSTLQVTVRDNYARVVRQENYVYSGGSWQLVSATNFQWNFSNQLVKRVVNTSSSYDLISGAIYEATYDGERKMTETDATGTVMTYTYDPADHVETVIKSSATLGAVTIADLTTKFTYDAADHVTQQIVGYGGSETLTSSRTFDDAGRLTDDYQPGPNGTSYPIHTAYTYDPANRQVTVSLPNGGTRTETYQADGNVQNRTGSALVPEYYTYAIQADGTRYGRVNVGTGTSTRLRETWSDWLGRATKTSKPGFTGQSAFVEESYYDATTGRLQKSTRTGFAPTLYEYDALSQPTRSGLDLNANDTLDLNSTDRIGEADQYFESTLGAWWLTKTQKTYPKANDSTALTVSTTRQRLTGFAAGVLAETRTTDVDGHTTVRTVAVDRAGKTTTITTSTDGIANSQTETILNGLSISVTGFDGLTYTTAYDALHRRSSSTAPRTGTTTTHYKTGSTFVDWVKDAANNTVATYSYDNAGRVVAVSDANTKFKRVDYNSLDQVLHQWGDTAYPVAYGYNTLGERTTLSTYRGGSGWTGTAWPASTTGSADTTTWTYDPPSGLLASKADATGKTVSYSYNTRGQTYQRFWARHVGNNASNPLLTTTYAYDSNTGELTDLTYNDTAEPIPTPPVHYTYTRAGQLDTVGDTTGTRSFVYNTTDPLQLDAVDLPAFYSSRVLTRQYDGIHRPDGFQLGTVGNLAGDLTQTYTYHATTGRFDHLDSASSAQSSRTFTYGYNSGGLLQSLTVESLAVSYAYEPNRDLLTKIDSQWSGTSRTRYDYVSNALGQRYTAKQSGDAFADLGGSTYYRYIYNDRGEMTSGADYLGDTPTPLGGTPDASAQLPSRNFAYGFDSIGNRTTASRNGPTAGTETYSTADTASAHGALNQYSSRTNAWAHAAGTVGSATTNVSAAGSSLLWSTAGRKGRFWAADAPVSGNNPSKDTVSVTATIAGGGSGGADLVRTDSRTAYLAAGLQSFSYDDDGNLIGDGVWGYTYDAENRLVQMTTTSVAVGAGFPNRTLEFRYDYLGRRVQKRSLNATAGTDVYRRFLYDGDNLVAELDATSTSCGNMLRSYTWGLDLAGSLTATGGVGALVQITDHATSTSYLPTYDGNGNIASLLRASDGVLAATYEYSPFGELLRCAGSYAASNPFRFSTKFTDDESGLVYYGARYYSPSLGRFINRDPIEEAGGLNLYGFCGNDAINGYYYLGYSWLSKLWKGAVRQVVSFVASVVVGVVVGIYAGPEAGIAAAKGTYGLLSAVNQAMTASSLMSRGGGGATAPPGMRTSSIFGPGGYSRSPFVMNYNQTVEDVWQAGAEWGTAAQDSVGRYVIGVLQGVWGAAKGTAQAIRHPIDTTIAVTNGIGTLAGRTIYDTAALGSDISEAAIETINDPLALGNVVGNIEGGLAIGAGAVRAVGAVRGAVTTARAGRISSAVETGAARASSIFKNGQILERTIQTSKGPVDVLAEVVVEGDTLVLKDIAIFGRAQAPLKGVTREMLEAIYDLREQARAAGFKKLRITGQRVPSSTSVNPGHNVDINIDLSK
jgi:RHS repeat-associated protein